MGDLTKLGTALYRDNWLWLQDENLEIANAVEEEVRSGAKPDEIGRFMVRHIGPDRSALIARCVSASRYLEQSK